uniref:Uncharacterized protein n=1 Tax=Acrobeloides nanus TaxID=290746 RepID=A0A914CPC5_9BILA
MKIYKKRTSQIKARKFIWDEKKAQKPAKLKDDCVTTRHMAKMKLSGQKERMEKPQLIIRGDGEKNEFELINVKHSVRKFENEVVSLNKLDYIEKELQNVLKENIQIQKIIEKKQIQLKSRRGSPKKNGSKTKKNDRKRSRKVETKVEVSKQIPKPSEELEEEEDDEESHITPAWHRVEFIGYHALRDFYTFIQPCTALIDAEFIKHWKEHIVDKFNSENFHKLCSVPVSQIPAIQLFTPKKQNESHDDASNQAHSLVDENRDVLPDVFETEGENSMLTRWKKHGLASAEEEDEPQPDSSTSNRMEWRKRSRLSNRASLEPIPKRTNREDSESLNNFLIPQEPTTSTNPSLKTTSLIDPTIFDDLGEELTKNLKLKGVLLDNNQTKVPNISEFATPKIELKPYLPPLNDLVEDEIDVATSLSIAKLQLAHIEPHLLALIGMTYDRIKAEYADNIIYRRLNSADDEVKNLVKEISTPNKTIKTPALTDDFRQKFESALEKRKIGVASIKQDFQPNYCLIPGYSCNV